MELLERYLNQIRKHLPLKDREDTLKELRSLLLEELDSKSNGSNDEEVLYEIIKSNGYPIEVASRYRNNEPLISSIVRPYFNMGIKIVSIVVPTVLTILKVLSLTANMDEISLMNILLELAYLIPSIIESLLFGYGIVFVIFVLMNRYAINEFKNEIPEFDPSNLPKLPSKVYKISIFEHVFGILMTVLLLYLLNYSEGLIGINFQFSITPLLNDNFTRLLPLINASLLFALIILIIELSRRAKSKVTITLDFIQTVFSGILMILLARTNFITEAIINEYNLDAIPNIIRVLLYIGAIAAIVGGTIKYIITLYKINSYMAQDMNT